MFQGSMNKFTLDDKGSTLLLTFGLPPFSLENDAIRCLYCVKCLHDALMNINIRSY